MERGLVVGEDLVGLWTPPKPLDTLVKWCLIFVAPFIISLLAINLIFNNVPTVCQYAAIRNPFYLGSFDILEKTSRLWLLLIKPSKSDDCARSS